MVKLHDRISLWHLALSLLVIIGSIFWGLQAFAGEIVENKTRIEYLEKNIDLFHQKLDRLIQGQNENRVLIEGKKDKE